MHPVTLGATDALDILCLGAHADDIEIGAGGTILVLAGEGRIGRITWVVMSADERRAAEARATAERFLAGVPERRIIIEDFTESYFPSETAGLKAFFERLKGEVEPDLILAPRREDLHQDHRVLAELTWNTFRRHLILEYEIPKYDADLGSPNTFVELPEWAMRRKADLILDGFPSQASRDWFDRETFLALARIRGLESRVPSRHAEAFHGRKLVLGTAPGPGRSAPSAPGPS
jgi:LmbE family N-acetylglucosaminyl deacetylase